VVAIPGLLADDDVLAIMRGWLCRIGYDPHAAGIGLNVDCSDRALDRLERRVEAIVRRAGRKVSLVGHSRGGQFGKALATRRPDLVSRLVSLGSPLAAPLDVSIPTRAFVAGLRSYLHASSPLLARNGCMTTTCLCPFADSFRAEWPASVPCTSVYTRSDGVVWWEACLVPYARSVEVGCSHVGMAVSAPVYHHIAAALAEPVDRWTAEGLTT
jgi:pimeloyl-ACP methyl ester carboxylesterase